MDQTIHTHILKNGLTVVVEPMSEIQSAAFTLLVPAGSVYDPAGQEGCAAVLSDLITRGAGDLDSKQLSSALDFLGLQRHEEAELRHISFGGATLATNLPDALRIYGDIVQRPHLPDDEFEPCLSGAEQALLALEDEPRQKVMIELRRRCYPKPWGLPSEGSLEGLEALTMDAVRQHHRRCFRPDEAILGIAGRVEPQRMFDLVEEAFGGWKSQPAPELQKGDRGARRDHIQHDSTQTQIGIAYDSVPYRDPQYYAAWAAVSVLSGGSSSRLFTEVRERRGLCYSVYAMLHSLKHEGRVLCYAGTNAERAQQTLDVTLGELQRIVQGIEPAELDRCKARAKSSLVMQQESSSARASSVAHDWYHLARVKTLAEVRAQIDALTVDSVKAHLEAHPPRDFTVLTLGPQPLEVSDALS